MRPEAQTNFLYDARRYCSLLAALLRQEEEIRRLAPLDSILELLEPIIMVGILSFLWVFLNRRNTLILGGVPILFYGTGFFPMYFFVYLSRRMRRSVEGPHRRFPIERRLDYVIVHIILRIADYAIVGILGFGCLYFFFTESALPHDFKSVIGACVSIVMIGFGWGIILMTSARYWFLSVCLRHLARPLMLVSGVFYVPDFLSPHARYVLSFNPMLQAIALFRQGFYPLYPHLMLDTRYLACCSIFMVVLGVCLERVSRRSE